MAGFTIMRRRPRRSPRRHAADRSNNQHGFTFQQYGGRVPAVVISPWIAKNVIDHRVYDHSSVPRTVERVFGLPYLTERDHHANDLLALVTLSAPRTDTPATLPGGMEAAASAVSAEMVRAVSPPVNRPDDTVDEGNLPAVVNAAMQQHLQAEPEKRTEILERVGQIQTRAGCARVLGGSAADREAGQHGNAGEIIAVLVA